MSERIPIVAAFPTPERAAHAVDELLRAGFDRAAIGLFSPDTAPGGSGRSREAAGAAVADSLAGQGVPEAAARRAADAVASGEGVVTVRAGARDRDAVQIFRDMDAELLHVEGMDEHGYPLDDLTGAFDDTIRPGDGPGEPAR
ncbi:hypothetical protein [Sphaerobacter sp.]|uniref:hypothetical protein n=1 Tax=Sphaerobacter sp. TaxID=2099654 RepID=UPI001E160B2D|nr:hypothetical protein [Sphaerobacter sp.]MBX5445528.1 hypothetical protein [Sphaerobacter sp.]